MKNRIINGIGLLLFSCLFFVVQAQKPVDKYAAAWKKVETHINNGLPKSALAEVRKIYNMAKTDKQDGQLLKAVISLASLQEGNRENGQQLGIAEMEKELSATSADKKALRAILNSMIASMYWNYFQDHRWQLYDRTKTTNFKKADIATWDVSDFHEHISSLYLASLKDEVVLQQTKLAPYDPVIIKGNVRHLRPTLFDLLGHTALEYFDNSERDLTRPAYAFEINDPLAFAPAAQFAAARFITRDSLSLHHKALQLYQRLIAFHLKDAEPSALLDADIARLQFVYSNSVQAEKEKLYEDALAAIVRKYGDVTAATQASYLLASLYDQQASRYKPVGDTSFRFERIKARQILERLIRQKDSSEGKVYAINLLNNINQPTLAFAIEKVNIPGEAFRALVRYRNVNKIYLRIIRTTEKLKNELTNEYDEKYWPAILAAEPIRSWNQLLPATNDLQEHKVEIKVDGLPAGDYVLIASSSADFKDASSVTGARMFYVSTISYVNNGEDYFILDRNTGRPMPKANIQTWFQKYDYKLSKYTREKGPAYTSNENGYVKIKQDLKEARSGRNPFILDITFGNDRLFMNDMVYDTYYQYQRETEAAAKNDVFFFTDRSIYRPGQLVFFKGILLNSNARERTGSVVKNFSTVVYLYDVNNQQVDSLNVTTNEFGSFNGQFRLPASGLTGEFSIATKKPEGSTEFSVEDYKRPKFFVEFDPVKGSYKVNERITVTGKALAYAGNNIDGATVKYRVQRTARFIYPWLYKGWYPRSESMEISNGEIKTAADGTFTIEFTAIPDAKTDPKLEPVFDYMISVDVTDIGGETRSSSKQVSVSYKSILLTSRIPASISSDSLSNLYIRSENMNGEFVSTRITVNIIPLDKERRLIRERLWERPDQFIMSKEEYVRNFPHDEYDNETDPASWKKDASVYSKTDSASREGNWKLSSKLAPGHYIIEIEARDEKNTVIKDQKFIEVYDASGQMNVPAYLWTGKQNTVVEPGGTATIELGTAANQVYLIQQLEREAGLTPENASPNNSKFTFTNVDNEKFTLRFPVQEKDRGGFGVNWIFVKHNRVYQHAAIVNVPWTNKQLKIEYLTHRDKTLPGSAERWKIRITGAGNEKLAAEMLATMYDASLDQFKSHSWFTPSIWPTYSSNRSWTGTANFQRLESVTRYNPNLTYKNLDKRYDRLLGAGYGYRDELKRSVATKTMNAESGNGLAGRVPGVQVVAQNEMMDSAAPPIYIRGNTDVPEGFDGLYVIDGVVYKPGAQPEINSNDVLEIKLLKGAEATALYGSDAANGVIIITTKNAQKNPVSETPRKNFNETAFFFPELRTDSTGAIEFSFTIPEALTKWKFMALAHTQNAAFGSSTTEVVTQKELMVQPNAPRFLRQGDKMEFSSKIANMSGKEITGLAELQLFDARTNESVDGQFRNMYSKQYFTVAAGASEVVKFSIEVPYQYNEALVWRIIAKAGDFTDGEENTMPVLTNRILVTETLNLPMRGTGTKNFTFQKLLESGNSESLQTHSLTLEYTSNPAWYAVQALPYLMEYPYECAEQTWNRYYANSLASFIANSSPRIKAVFEKWKTTDTAALLSNLEKNSELKSILLEETPWLVQGKSESEQKRNIAMLFDMVRMSEQLSSSYDKLKKLQSSNGGFVWFAGGPDDRYMTQYIITGIGHLQKVKAIAKGQESKLNNILSEAIPYLDQKIKEDYNNLLKSKSNLSLQQIGYTQIQYLYMRSFFPAYKIDAATKTAYDYYFKQAKQFWTKQSKYMQGMISLVLSRADDKIGAAPILKSLKETAIVNEELGMYWNEQRRGWFWYEAPIETQALLIEAFVEAGNDMNTADDLRTWLLKNKQTNNWATTRATAEACYALLLQGSDWLSTEPTVEIKLGPSQTVSSEQGKEAGTGYFKKVIEGGKVNSNMGNISVTVKSSAPTTSATWGSVYWQYFEDVDKITSAATPLSLVKKLFVEKNSDRGPVLTPVTDGSSLKIGDKIKVRIELRVDREMEYVHMKDMRASSFEPVNVLSGYKYQGGLGYYESTRDASTNFFFSNLRKGTYVFEYTLFVTHAGNFSNGITSIQCMYAPEFSSHSEGIRVNVE